MRIYLHIHMDFSYSLSELLRIPYYECCMIYLIISLLIDIKIKNFFFITNNVLVNIFIHIFV